MIEKNPDRISCSKGQYLHLTALFSIKRQHDTRCAIHMDWSGIPAASNLRQRNLVAKRATARLKRMTPTGGGAGCARA